MINEQMQFFLRGFRRDAHPMAILTGLVGALSAFYHDSTDINNPEHREISAIRLIAKMPTLVSMAYKYTSASPTSIRRTTFVRRQLHAHEFPRPARTTTRTSAGAAMDRSSSSTPTTNRTPRPRRCASRLLRTNPFAAIAAGWPASGVRRTAAPRGGATCWRTCEMGGVEKIGDFIKQVKDKNSGIKLMASGTGLQNSIRAPS